MLGSKKAGISIWFVIVVIVCIVIWLKFKDTRTAALVFFGYVGFRILVNFLKKGKVEYYEDY